MITYRSMDYRAKIQKIRSDYLRGKITLDDARQAVELLLVEMNKKGEKIAKKFGKKYYPLKFNYVFR